MKQYLAFFISLLCTVSLSTAQYSFTMDKALECTSVQDQQKTNTCWSFATASFLESEILRNGGHAVNLSEMYTVREIYLDKARNYLLRQGKANFAEGGLSHDVIHAINAYGAMPEDAYPGREKPSERLDHSELITVMKSVLDGLLAKQIASDKWPDVINGILDVYLGPVPAEFKVGNTTYTPQSYAKSLNLNMDEYVSLTSFTHHPFYEKFVLEIPDNHANGSYYNVPLEDLTRIIDNAIAHGYTVAWDGDVSEKGFNAEAGIAVVPQGDDEQALMRPMKEKSITQAGRQKAFETYQTTDDHLMHIIGTAHDQNGTKYYMLKNSWGTVGRFDGYLYMSVPYVQSKTIAIMVHRDAIPTDIAGRIAM